MLIKSDPDAVKSFLTDASYMSEGRAESVVFPETAEEVADILKAATRDKTPVTVSGAGTGTVGGRIPMAGVVLATDKLNKIKSMARDEHGGGSVVAEAGVRLVDLQQFVESEGLFYAPDPTERSCYLGGTIATNASGARSFKYGPTRSHVLRIKVALATGELLDLRRGELRADVSGQIKVPLPCGRVIEATLPTYQMPKTRKHAAGYYVAPEMDVLDLFIGSEGTLGVVTEAEVALLPKPEGLLSGVVFFDDESKLLAFVREAREQSLLRRQSAEIEFGRLGALMEKAMEITDRGGNPEMASDQIVVTLDARALEYFDVQSLNFLREKYETVPEDAVGAVFFEQETTPASEDVLMTEWLALLERHGALIDSSWFATNESDQAGLREFRHQLPVLMNKWFARHQQRKVSTDIAVPDEEFPGTLEFYKQALSGTDLKYTIFGHIGDNHVHVNILPRDDREAEVAGEIYQKFIRQAIAVGGTVSAEHGIGKLKRKYLRELYGDEHVREIARLKQKFDPAGILGKGNMFSETDLE